MDKSTEDAALRRLGHVRWKERVFGALGGAAAGCVVAAGGLLFEYGQTVVVAMVVIGTIVGVAWPRTILVVWHLIGAVLRAIVQTLLHVG